MKFQAVTSGVDHSPHFEGDEATALYVAIKRTPHTGEDHEVIGAGSAATYFYIEADTKVDEAEMTFPVIVHVRDWKLS